MGIYTKVGYCILMYNISNELSKFKNYTINSENYDLKYKTLLDRCTSLYAKRMISKNWIVLEY